MCGLVGFTAGTLPADADPDHLVRDMTDAIRSRGPDGEGYYRDPWLTLGHCRLSIIDLAQGAQPMSLQNGRFQLVYNGELYNYKELRNELEEAGFAFSTRSDTEVLLQVLVAHGIDGLQKCNGMFAFVFYDRDRKEIWLGRDRMGIKPLYYSRIGGGIVFASELKALIRHPSVDRSMDLLSVSKYLTYGYIPAPHSIYRNAYKLESGHVLKVGEGVFEKRRYWDMPLVDSPVSAMTVDQHAERILELLEDAVEKRLRSDVPVGLFLSGGIDSSTLTALAARRTGRTLRTFSIGFEESSYDESPYAKQVAELYGTEHHHEVLSEARALAILPDAMKAFDEPFADASLIPTFLLSQFAAKHVKVCLGGDGSDELFAGYPSFQAHRLMERLSFLPISWRDRLNRLARKLPVSHRYASLEFLLQQFFKGAGVSAEIRFALWMGYFDHEQKRALLTEPVQRQLIRENPFEDILAHVRESRLDTEFARILYLCSKLYLQDDILAKVDRASMAHSLEVRVPYLDHHLVEYVSGIHPAHKLNGFTTKYVLKKAVAGLLPRKIIHRRKAGFMIPLAVWLQRDLRPWVEELCSKEELEKDGIFNYEYVRRLLDEHVQSKRDHRKLIWSIFCFQWWRRQYGG